jgi:DNA-binding NarL/FixJ family response regulator
MPRLRILVVEDSLIVREGVVGLLERCGFTVAGQAADVAGALDELHRLRPDCAVVDIRMPPTQTDEGIELARAIRKHFRRTGVLVLSQYVEADLAVRLMGSGEAGLGYVLKDSITDRAVLANAVERVTALETVLDRRVVDDLMSRGDVAAGLRELTTAEQRVLTLIAEGRSNLGIAEALLISQRTVDAHLRAIFRKLELHPSPEIHRRVLAVLRFLNAGGHAAEDATVMAPAPPRQQP